MFYFIYLFIKRNILLTLEDIEISKCVHYCGFFYSKKSFNPYMNYIETIHNNNNNNNNNNNFKKAREKFIDFLKYYRPLDMSDALGINLSIFVPLWIYPWRFYSKKKFFKKRGWFKNPEDCPDILTHFSENGILKSRIDEEFFWLERAYSSILKDGYNPKKYKNYIEVIELIKEDNSKKYLVVDGNHRISVMGVVGNEKARVIILKRIYEKKINNWFAVKNGYISKDDSLLIFNSYFFGNKKYKTTNNPAKII